MTPKLGKLACLIWLLSALCAMQARAETIALAGETCRIDGQSFDDEEHALWYDRFWTGSCSGLWFSGCWPGDSWPDLVNGLAAKHGQEEAKDLVPRFCALGRAMGHEWARDNAVRSISTDDLEAWYQDLRSVQDLEAALLRYETLIESRLASP